MDCNKEEAIRAKGIAENKMKNNDFAGARKIALRAQQLYQDLENISQMIMVCDVHCSAEKKILGNEMDWYGILQVEKTADEVSIRKQFRKYALQLHPDKNKFPGAETAFKLIGEAHRVLSDKGKRSLHDIKQQHASNSRAAPSYQPQNNFRSQHQKQQQQPSTQAGTFWTMCPFCSVRYQYYRNVINSAIFCQTCGKSFVAYERGVQGVPTATNFSKPTFYPKKDVPSTGAFKVEQVFKGNVAPDIYKTASSQKVGCSSGAGKAKMNNNKGRKQVVESSGSCDTQSSSSDSEVEVKIDENGDFQAGQNFGCYGDQNPRRSNRQKQRVSYRENLSDDDDLVSHPKRAKGSGSSNFTEKENDASNGQAPDMDKQSGSATDVKEEQKGAKHKESTCFEGSLSDRNKVTGKVSIEETVKVAGAENKSAFHTNDSEKNFEAHASDLKGRSEAVADSTSDSKSAQAPEGYVYEDPDFNDFEKDRKEECFAVGQTWAVFDPHDAMPRFYARIRKVFTSGFKLRITWLEPDPVDENEIEWIKEELPVSCGRFRNGSTVNTQDHAMFSHLVSWEKGEKKDTYNIFPRKGQTWLTFHNILPTPKSSTTVLVVMSSATRIRRLGTVTAAVVAGGTAILLSKPSVAGSDSGPSLDVVRRKINDANPVIPSRAAQESALIAAGSGNPLDILVIGGGATGSGVALDAVTRGLRVGLVEREDFASGTSSRSTKLIHGGVRYLEKAVFNLDYGQLRLVFHALEERKQVIDNAPHLCHALPCMTPCFNWFEVVYYWMGLKMYDLVAGARLLHLSRYYSAQESAELFPTLAMKGKDQTLRGTVVYYDGQMNDARLNVGLALTAALAGAAILNHAEVVSLIRDESSQRIIGARIRNNLSGKEFDTYAKVIVNAAGPFCDSVRKLADKNVQPMICPSSGVHIILPDYYSPEGMGLIVPKTKDGRVVFMLPWLGRTVAGTTDSNTIITLLPEPHEDEIQFILDAISDYLNVKVRRTDVLSAWSGIRPLATDPSAKNTENISRDHVVCEDIAGLVTITGGKWTTYRGMAEDAVNAAIKSGKLSPTNECITHNLRIIGGDGWEPSSFTVLAQHYVRMKRTYGGKVVPAVMDTAAARHLSHAYGMLAERVAAIAQNEGLGKRLAHGYPFLEAEVAYCARHEYCESAVDFIARRCRLAFLDTDAAQQALPRVIEILTTEHNWDKSRQKQELEKAKQFLETFKSSKNAQFHDGKHQ